jgi:hypothetical protein
MNYKLLIINDMKTTELIFNIVFAVLIVVVMIWQLRKQVKFLKELKSVAKQIDDMITEAVSVRDEIQSLFDAFEESLDRELKKEGPKMRGVPTFEKETVWIKNLLPERYKCEPRENGVHCYDITGEGINDDHKASESYDPETDDHWMLICKAIKKEYGSRLMEIFSQEAVYHSKFTVYLRPKYFRQNGNQSIN